MDAPLRQYIETALWASNDDARDPEGYGRPMDDRYGIEDLTPEAIESMRSDLADFLEANAEDLAGIDPEQAAHDFWLTRNRHGAGFWDRGLGEIGSRLTDAAHAYGESYLYSTDDGKVHVA